MSFGSFRLSIVMAIQIIALTLVALSSTSDLTGRSSTDCGANCLFAAMYSIDQSKTPRLSVVIEKLSPGLQGNNLDQLRQLAEEQQFPCLAVRTDLETLESRERPFACIAHMKRGHYVIIQDLDKAMITVVDPPRSYSVARDAFAADWSGNCLLIAATALESEGGVTRRTAIRRTLRRGTFVVAFIAALTVGTMVVRRMYASRRSRINAATNP
jgi:ABC-type bacteriocin/lantibiotic exporter with double-glycine peptidase domain